MKKIIGFIVFLFIAAFILSSCAGSHKGFGCPQTSSNKPFRS